MSSVAVTALLITAPYFAYRFVAPGANITVFRLALLASLAGVMLDHASRSRAGTVSERRPVAPLLVPLWLFVVYCAFQTTRSQHDIALPILLVTVEGALTVTVLVAFIRTPSQLVRLTTVYAAGAAIPFLIGFYQVRGVVLTSTIPPLPLTEALERWLVPYDASTFGGIHLMMIEDLVFPRVASTLVDANFFGAYVASVLLCIIGRTVGLVLEDARRWVAIAIHSGMAAVGLVVLLFTMSRSAWLGFGCGAAFLSYHATSHRRDAMRIRLVIIAVAALSAAFAWQVLATTGFDLTILALSRAQDVTGGFEVRYEMASAAIEAFAENPVIGIGRANLIGYTGYATAHSFYLSHLAEDGLVGMAFLGVWLAMIWTRSAALSDGGVAPQSRWIAMGLRSALVALLVANLPYDHLMSTEVNWALLGLCCAAGAVVPPREDSAEGEGPVSGAEHLLPAAVRTGPGGLPT
jgi:O-antigen ligase